jgi:hypothetical protein
MLKVAGKMRLDIVSRGSISFKEQFNTKPIDCTYKLKQGPNPWPHSCGLVGDSLRVLRPRPILDQTHASTKPEREVSGGKFPGRIRADLSAIALEFQDPGRS